MDDRLHKFSTPSVHVLQQELGDAAKYAWVSNGNWQDMHMALGRRIGDTKDVDLNYLYYVTESVLKEHGFDKRSRSRYISLISSAIHDLCTPIPNPRLSFRDALESYENCMRATVGCGDHLQCLIDNAHDQLLITYNTLEPSDKKHFVMPQKTILPPEHTMKRMDGFVGMFDAYRTSLTR